MRYISRFACIIPLLRLQMLPLVVVESLSSTTPQTHFIFPGGGVFFNWQGGIISYLRENNYDFSSCTFSGSSAGSLTASLAATGVDFHQATDLALQLAARHQVWDRREGLQGILDPMMEEWLDTLIPKDLDTQQVNDRLSILVTPLPFLWRKEKLTTFANRQELIDANLASIYLPFFSNKSICRFVNQRPYMDGNFLSTGKHYRPASAKASNTIVWNWQKDPLLKDKGEADLVATLKPQAVWELVEQGKRYAASMEQKGRFQNIPKLQV